MAGMGKSIRNLYVDDAAFDEDEENDAASGEAAEDGAEGAEEAEEAEEAEGGADAGEAAPQAGADGEGGSVAEDAVSAVAPHSQLIVLPCAQSVISFQECILLPCNGFICPDFSAGLCARLRRPRRRRTRPKRRKRATTSTTLPTTSWRARDEEEEGLAEQPGDSDGERERKRRKRKRRARALQLDNEDYELLEENQVSVGAHQKCTSCSALPLAGHVTCLMLHQLLHQRLWQQLKTFAVAISQFLCARQQDNASLETCCCPAGHTAAKACGAQAHPEACRGGRGRPAAHHC